MANNQAFKIKNGLSAGRYLQNVGTETAGSVASNNPNSWVSYGDFSVSSQDTSPTGVYIKTDGTKMYVVGSTNDTVFQYSLSTAWDVTTASYDSVSKSISAQETIPFDIFFKSDGTSMYIIGQSSDAISQYTLGTAWDISTASYSQQKSVSGQGSEPRGLYFKSDGLRVFTADAATNSVFSYTLSTAWDISTASYDSKSLVTTSDGEDNPGGVALNQDGTFLYVIGDGARAILQYQLTTAYDLSTATITSSSYPFDQSIGGIHIKPDNTKVYLVDYTQDAVTQITSTLTTQTLDLSTGNYFNHALTEDIKIELSNPPASGKAYAAQIEVTGGAVGPAGLFSTTLYTGTGADKTITNGIDLAGEGGLVWIKSRSSTREHSLYDTERGVEKLLKTNSTGAEQNTSGGLTAFNSDGFSLGTYADINGTAYGDFASWTFRKAPNFFDVVTYTGNGVAGRTVAHSLGSVPGSIIVKATNNARSWAVYHKDADSTAPEDYVLYLDVATNKQNDATLWNDTAPTSTDFTVGTSGDSNVSGREYVAYLFADDDTNRIKCGGYLGNATSVNLGFQPQFIIVKNASLAENWMMFDTVRGWDEAGVNIAWLMPNSSNAESTITNGYFRRTSTGFDMTSGYTPLNNGSASTEYIYIAIGESSSKSITWSDSIKWDLGVAPVAPDAYATDLHSVFTVDGGTTYYGAKIAGDLS